MKPQTIQKEAKRSHVPILDAKCDICSISVQINPINEYWYQGISSIFYHSHHHHAPLLVPTPFTDLLCCKECLKSLKHEDIKIPGYVPKSQWKMWAVKYLSNQIENGTI